MSRHMMLQRGIESKYSKHNIRVKVEEDIKSSKLEYLFERIIDDINQYRMGDYYTSKNERIRNISSILTSEIVLEIFVIITPINGVQPIQSIASKLAMLFNKEDIFNSIKTASELLAVACKSDMFDVIAANKSDTGSLMVRSRYSLEEETIQFIQETRYLPPMIVEPRTIVSNTSSGYLTKNESVILGKNNHHEHYQALDVLNISQAIQLSLDLEVLKLEEQPQKVLDTPEKASNYVRFMISSRLVYNDMIDCGNKFYLTYKFDKRGRIYSQGYHINIQSTEYKKASINLYTKHLITL